MTSLRVVVGMSHGGNQNGCALSATVCMRAGLKAWSLEVSGHAIAAAVARGQQACSRCSSC